MCNALYIRSSQYVYQSRTRQIVRVEAGIHSDNPASMRVLEKCGFTREAVHKKAVTKNGRLLDEVVYVRFAEAV